ncbi:MAG: hypothetical protein MR966_05805, partial [Lachnospiraceae bacterium]|nr:hypothetical protein [Lachnospiraceae bacterium]
EPTSKTLRVSSVWRIRQIDLYKKVLMNASIHHTFYTTCIMFKFSSAALSSIAASTAVAHYCALQPEKSSCIKQFVN